MDNVIPVVENVYATQNGLVLLANVEHAHQTAPTLANASMAFVYVLKVSTILKNLRKKKIAAPVKIFAPTTVNVIL